MLITGRRKQPSRSMQRTRRRLLILEGVVLAAAAPFLLLPELFPLVTATGLLALGVVWLVSLFFIPPPASPFNVAFLLWGLALIMGILATADPADTLPKATGLILGLAVWRYLLLAVQARRHIVPVVAIFLLSSVSFSVFALFALQELPKIPYLAGLNPAQAATLPGRLAGLAIHPNQLAGFICLYLPVLVSLLIAPPAGLPSRRLRPILAALALMASFTLLITQSRGGWLAAIAGLFALMVLWAVVLPPSNDRRWLRLAATGCVLLVITIAVRIGPDRIRDLWLNPPDQTALGTLSTLNYRKELWPWAVAAIEDFPYSGVGLGAFRQVAFRLYPLPLVSAIDIGHAHNIFLQTALDVGLPGLVVYVAILFLAATVAINVARRDEGFRSVALGLLAGLIAIHVFGLADALALGSKPGTGFWFALGLLAAMNKLEPST